MKGYRKETDVLERLANLKRDAVSDHLAMYGGNEAEIRGRFKAVNSESKSQQVITNLQNQLVEERKANTELEKALGL